MAKKTVKKTKAPQDATLRNVRAARKAIKELSEEVVMLRHRVTDLEDWAEAVSAPAEAAPDTVVEAPESPQEATEPQV